MPRIVRALCIAGVIASTLALAACQSPEPGTSDSFGTIKATLGAPPDRLTDAAAQSVEELKLLDIDSAVSKVDGHVTAHTAQGKDVDIRIEEAGHNISKISIRIGSMGNERLSIEILNHIKDKLDIKK